MKKHPAGRHTTDGRENTTGAHGVDEMTAGRPVVLIEIRATSRLRAAERRLRS